jgi:hypothetical protein
VLTDQEIENLQKEMQHQFQAMVEGDVETLEGIYSDDYVITSRKGALLEKADWIQMLASGRLKYLSIEERTGISIHLYGNVAVIRGLIGSTVYEIDGERLETGPRRFTAVWVYEKDTWRQVTRHHTAVTAEEEKSKEKEST